MVASNPCLSTSTTIHRRMAEKEGGGGERFGFATPEIFRNTMKPICFSRFSGLRPRKLIERVFGCHVGCGSSSSFIEIQIWNRNRDKSSEKRKTGKSVAKNYVQARRHEMVFFKVARAEREPGIFWFSFIFFLNCSAVDHSATAPPP